MPGCYCCVPMCKSNTLSAESKAKGVSFHIIPGSEEVKQKWIKNIRRDNWIPSDMEKVCSLHFVESDYFQGTKRRRLYPHAVPTVFPDYPSYLQLKTTNKKRKLPLTRPPPKLKKRGTNLENQKGTADNPETPESSSSPQQSLVEHLENESANKELCQVKQYNEILRKEIKVQYNKITRLQKSLGLYRVLVGVLRDEIKVLRQGTPALQQDIITLPDDTIFVSIEET